VKRNKPLTTFGLLAFLAMPSYTRISKASGFFGLAACCHLGLFIFFGLSLSACSTSEKSVSGIEPIPEMRTRLITRWGQEVLTSTLETSTVPEPGNTTWAAVNDATQLNRADKPNKPNAPNESKESREPSAPEKSNQVRAHKSGPRDGTKSLEINSAVLAMVRNPIPVAVTTVTDKTGAAKSTDQGTTNSRAVSQGATELLKFVVSSSYFKTIFQQFDRANLQALLTERQLYEEKRRNRQAAGGRGEKKPVNLNVDKASGQLGQFLSQLQDGLNRRQALTPVRSLEPVDYLISGAIVGYDPNIKSGGSGVKIAGVGPSSKDSTDEISIVLYMTDVASGQIKATSLQSGLVRSELEQFGLFGFVSPDLLVEFEAGRVNNDSATGKILLSLTRGLEDLVGQIVRITGDKPVIQIGYYKNIENVDSVVLLLRNNGIVPLVTEMQVGSEVVFQVATIPIADFTTREARLKQIQTLGFHDAQFINN
jgi:curli biogenesis system outer membrane secretion channel CsgG